jgi:DNA-binding LacI/PurR family transcriptional regulator
MKPTMKDIAQVAQVSEGTVSNVINNRKGVSAETAERIFKIAEEMGYLRKRSDSAKSKNIKYIVFKKHGDVVSLTSFYSDMIEEIEKECRAQDYELLISHIITSKNDIADSINSMDFDHLAGIIIQATEMDESDMQYFRTLKIPAVVIDNYFQNELYDYVLINFKRGAYLAIKYLIGKGHTDIGILSRKVDITSGKLRKEGFDEALRECGIEENTGFQYELDSSLDGSYRDMAEILKDKSNKMPTAFLAYNDTMSFGVIKAMTENGIALPEQISIIGFDDVSFCDISHPRLTTVKSYNREIGNLAVRRLLSRIENKNMPRVKIDVDIDLIERESVFDRNKANH